MIRGLNEVRQQGHYRKVALSNFRSVFTLFDVGAARIPTTHSFANLVGLHPPSITAYRAAAFDLSQSIKYHCRSTFWRVPTSSSFSPPSFFSLTLHRGASASL